MDKLGTQIKELNEIGNRLDTFPPQQGIPRHQYQDNNNGQDEVNDVISTTTTSIPLSSTTVSTLDTSEIEFDFQLYCEDIRNNGGNGHTCNIGPQGTSLSQNAPQRLPGGNPILGR